MSVNIPGNHSILCSSFVLDESNASSPMGNQITSVVVSDDNTLWISNWGKGIDYCRLADNGFSHHFTKAEALSKNSNNFIRGIVEGSDGNFYCNTQFAGVIQLDKNLKFKKTISTAFTNALGIDVSKSNLFFGEGILIKYNLSSKKLTTIKQVDSSLGKYYGSRSYYFFSSLKNGNTLVASKKGVWVLDSKRNTLTELPGFNDEGVEQSIFAYEDRNGNIYKYSLTYGLQLYKLINGRYKTAYTFPEKFTAKYVYEENDSTAWIASTNGLYLFNPLQLKIKKHYTTSDGLPNNVVYAIAPDTMGRLWLSTNKGISTYTKTTGRFKSFSGISGMQGNEYNSHTVVTASDGRIIFGGVNGLTVIYPWEVKPETATPKIQITSIKADSSINPFQFDEGDKNVLQLPAGSNAVEFNFVGIEYHNPEACQLKYRLSGYDDEWVSSKNPGYARYVHLKPANYTFEIMAANADGVWSKEVKQLQIKINAAWCQQSWFKILLIFLMVTAVLTSIRLYIKQKLYRQKLLMEKQQAILQERERIIADLHDDVGATLSSMHIYGDLAEEVWETKPQQSKDMVSKITTPAKELMNRMGDIVWSLKPFGDDKNTLAGRLKNYSNELLASKNIECEFEIDEAANNSIINPVARKNILLIAKEAMNNIAKYSKASVASIHLSQENDEVILDIKDNGIGFDKALLKPGNGLQNMEHRSALLNGQCKIESTPGRGTHIHCIFPIAIISHA